MFTKSEPIIPSPDQVPPARVLVVGDVARFGKTVSTLDPAQPALQKTHQQSSRGLGFCDLEGISQKELDLKRIPQWSKPGVEEPKLPLEVNPREEIKG